MGEALQQVSTIQEVTWLLMHLWTTRRFHLQLEAEGQHQEAWAWILGV